MSLYERFLNTNFMKAMRGEEYNTSSPSSSPKSVKGANSLFTMPDITEENMTKYLGAISFYDYDVKYDPNTKEHTQRIVDIFYDNVHKVAYKPTNERNISLDGYKVHICSGFASLCYIEFKVGNDKYSLMPSKLQIAKLNYLITYLSDKAKSDKLKRLDNHLDIENTYKSHRLKGGILKMTEQEVLESLLETHPQHFI